MWLQEGHPALAPTQGIKLDSAMFTKLCMPGFALRSKANNTLYASLGNYVWSAMVWSTRIISTEPDAWTFQLHHKGRPFEGPAMSLIKACIQRPGNGLHQQDLLRLARHLALAPTQGLEFQNNAAHDDLLKAIW